MLWAKAVSALGSNNSFKSGYLIDKIFCIYNTFDSMLRSKHRFTKYLNRVIICVLIKILPINNFQLML